MFDGLGTTIKDLARLSNAKSRSICMENRTGEKGAGGMATEGTGAACARDLGKGWKVSPSALLQAFRYAPEKYLLWRITAAAARSSTYG